VSASMWQETKIVEEKMTAKIKKQITKVYKNRATNLKDQVHHPKTLHLSKKNNRRKKGINI